MTKSTPPSSSPRTLSLGLGQRRQEDDGGVASARVLLQARARLEAVHLRHHDVQHDEVGDDTLGDRQRVLAALGDEQPIAVPVERLVQDLEVRRIVVHQQDLRCVCLSGLTLLTVLAPSRMLRSRAGRRHQQHERIGQLAEAVEVEVHHQAVDALPDRRPPRRRPAISSRASAWMSLTSPSATASRSGHRYRGPPLGIGKVAGSPAAVIALGDEPHAEVFLQHGEQRFGTNRLRQVVDAAGFARRLPGVSDRVRGDGDDRNVAVAGSRPRRRVASRPSRSLILRSMKMTSGRWARASSMASRPPAAVMTLTPALSRRLASIRRLAVLSSTTSAVSSSPGASLASSGGAADLRIRRSGPGVSGAGINGSAK